MIDYRVEGGGARILREEQVLFETPVALVGVILCTSGRIEMEAKAAP